MAGDECTQIHEFLITTKAEDWPGSMFDFVAHMKDQANACNEKATVPLTDDQIWTHVEKAIHSVPDLCKVQLLANQNAKLTGTSATLTQCHELLDNAAMAFDLEVGKVSKRASHRPFCHINATLMDDNDSFHDVPEPPDLFDLDTPLCEVQ